MKAFLTISALMAFAALTSCVTGYQDTQEAFERVHFSEAGV